MRVACVCVREACNPVRCVACGPLAFVCGGHAAPCVALHAGRLRGVRARRGASPLSCPGGGGALLPCCAPWLALARLRAALASCSRLGVCSLGRDATVAAWSCPAVGSLRRERRGSRGVLVPSASEVGRDWEPPPRGAPWGALSAVADSARKELPDVLSVASNHV